MISPARFRFRVALARRRGRARASTRLSPSLLPSRLARHRACTTPRASERKENRGKEENSNFFSQLQFGCFFTGADSPELWPGRRRSAAQQQAVGWSRGHFAASHPQCSPRIGRGRLGSCPHLAGRSCGRFRRSAVLSGSSRSSACAARVVAAATR